MAGAAATFLALGGDYSIFHFNRVEGAYLGLGYTFDRLIPRTEFSTRAGYGFAEKHGQFSVGVKYRLWMHQRLDVGAEARQLIVNRPVQPNVWTNPTFDVLTSKHDPFDYYYERGFRTFISGKLMNYTSLTLAYSDFRQRSVEKNTEFSILSPDAVHRPNPSVDDGRLRSVSAEFSYDSRKLTKLKGRDRTSPQVQYTLFKAGAEYSSSRRLRSDFDFQRYSLYLYRSQRMGRLGLSSMTMYGGISRDRLPPQRFYQVISGAGTVSGGGGFYTVCEQGFVGDRAASIFVEHDFGHLLLRGSGLPLIKKIPFTLSVHGGAFWTDFHNGNAPDGFQTAPGPYGEVGFGIGNLTPFLSVFNFRIRFSWQLSHYSGDRFALTWGIGL